MPKNKVSRKELVKELEIRTGLSKRVLFQIVESILEEIKRSLDLLEPVKISKFGTFSVTTTKVRPGRNLKTGEVVPIQSFKKVLFHLSATLRFEFHNERKK